MFGEREVWRAPRPQFPLERVAKNMFESQSHTQFPIPIVFDGGSSFYQVEHDLVQEGGSVVVCECEVGLSPTPHDLPERVPHLVLSGFGARCLVFGDYG